MKRIINRALSIALALCMVLALAPGTILAEGEEGLPDIPLFRYKFFASNVFDCWRTPDYPTIGKTFYVHNFDNPYNSITESQIVLGTRYIQFAWADGATATDTKLALKLYEADGTFVQNISDNGYLYGKFDEGFFYEGHGHYGYIFTSSDFKTGGSFTFPAATHGKIIALSDLEGYTPQPTPGMLLPIVIEGIKGVDAESSFAELDEIVAYYEALPDTDKAQIDADLTAKYEGIAADHSAVKAVADLAKDITFLYNADNSDDIAAMNSAISGLSEARQAIFATTDAYAALTDYANGKDVYDTLNGLIGSGTMTRAALDTYEGLTDGAKDMVKDTLDDEGTEFAACLAILDNAKAVEAAIGAIADAEGDEAVRTATLAAKAAYQGENEAVKSLVLDNELSALHAALVALVEIDKPGEDSVSTAKLSSGGGEVIIKLTGTDLDLMGIRLEVYSGETKTSISTDVSEAEGVIGGAFTLPSNTSSSAKTYTIKLVLVGPSGLETVLDSPSYSVTVSGAATGGSFGNPTQPSQPGNTDLSTEVIVDGVPVDAGKVEVDSDAGVTKTVVNQDIIVGQIENAHENVTVVVPKSEDTPSATAELVVQNVDDMAKSKMTLTVQVGNVQYELPTTAVDTAAVMAALGADDPAQTPVMITVTMEVDAETYALVSDAISAFDGEIVFPPMQFKVTASYGGQTVDITEFTAYVTRGIEITAEQAAKITTALVVEPDGTSRQVPTNVYQRNGKWYAEINSLTNSTYVLIFNELTFSDAEGKWYEKYVNEMGSRKIIAGVGDNLFAGERDITRAEFAAIVVRALGLPSDSRISVFDDVSPDAWYYGAVGKAYEYGLITGTGENKFAPDKEITRQEAMLMIQRAAKIAGLEGKAGSLDGFSDADTISEWALEAAMWNAGSGLIAGYDGQLHPLDNITRAETAAVVLRLLQQAKLVDIRS